MRTGDFNRFMEYLVDADVKDPVWWAGYMWIDLTERQIKRVTELLKAKEFEQENGYVILPSGIGIKEL